MMAALLCASSFVSFIYFLNSTQREHNVPAPGPHCSVPLRWLAHVLLTNYSENQKLGRGAEIPPVFGKIAWNLLWHLTVFSHCPLTQISYKCSSTTLAMWARLKQVLKEVSGRETIVCSNRECSHLMSIIPFLLSNLWLPIKGICFFQPSLYNTAFSCQTAHIEILLLVQFCFEL